MNTLPDTSALIAFGCIGLFVLVLAVLLAGSLRQRQAYKKTLARMGFTPITATDPALLERVERIHRHRPEQRLKISSAYRRTINTGVMYLYDLTDTSGGENSTIESGLLGVSAEHLNLPYFVLLSWAGSASGGLSGMAASAAQNIIDWAMRKADLQKISLPYAGKFHTSYSLFGKDEPAVLDLLTPECCAALLALGTNYELHASGDFFSIKTGARPAQNETITFATQPEVMMADAVKIKAILEKTSPRPAA